MVATPPGTSAEPLFSFPTPEPFATALALDLLLRRPAHAFFAELSRRTGGAVPPPLLPSATWATPRLAPRLRGWRLPRRCAAG